MPGRTISNAKSRPSKTPPEDERLAGAGGKCCQRRAKTVKLFRVHRRGGIVGAGQMAHHENNVDAREPFGSLRAKRRRVRQAADPSRFKPGVEMERGVERDLRFRGGDQTSIWSSELRTGVRRWATSAGAAAAGAVQHENPRLGCERTRT